MKKQEWAWLQHPTCYQEPKIRPFHIKLLPRVGATVYDALTVIVWKKSLGFHRYFQGLNFECFRYEKAKFCALKRLEGLTL